MTSFFSEQTFKNYKKSDRKKFFFAILLLLQFVIITIFQTRLSIRNHNLDGPLNIIKSNCQNLRFAFVNDYMDYFAVENYLFIAYQVFLIHLGLIAIFNEYVMQLCVYYAMNLGGYIYSIIQMVEVKLVVRYVRAECLAPELTYGNEILEIFRLNDSFTDPGTVKYDLPQFIFYTLFIIITGYLSLDMYSRIGTNHYLQKKVGNDEFLMSLFKRQLILKILLKIFAFFSSLYFIFCIYFLLTYFGRKDYTMTLAVLIFLLIFILLLRLTRVTFFYLDEESESGMIYFRYLWVLVLFNNIVLCVIGGLFMSDDWYFLLPYNLVYFGVSLASYIFALNVKNDFGKGLKDAIAKNKTEREQISRLQSALNDNTEEIITVNINNEKQ
uniref:Transmembrane protein n=1 Tax=Anthurium amnicola TaxID=1678845 RepID=A0A1D1ZDV1_9ARAE